MLWYPLRVLRLNWEIYEKLRRVLSFAAETLNKF